jgi:hypothetical protein
MLMMKERRPAFPTIGGWARSVLVEAGAIRNARSTAGQGTAPIPMPARPRLSSLSRIGRPASHRKRRSPLSGAVWP